MRVPPIATVSVDTSALRENLAAVVDCAGVPAYCVVKADAYGHGAALVTRSLAAESGCHGFVVSRLEEAVALRTSGALAECPDKSLICLGAFLASHSKRARAEVLELLVANRVSLVIVCREDVDALIEAPGALLARIPPVHIAVDTGMCREGVEPEQLSAVLDLLREEGIGVASVFSHYVESEVLDSPITARQEERFDAALSESGVTLGASGAPEIHMANSAAAVANPQRYQAARAGGALYGVIDVPPELTVGLLLPVMSVRSRLVQVQAIPAGMTVGYNRTWQANRDSIIGLVATGYADGLAPRLPDLGWVPGSREDAVGHPQPMLRTPVVGTVSMDLVTIDLTDAAQQSMMPPAIGDEVVILGTASSDREVASPSPSISAAEHAELMNCSPYAVTVAFGRRLPVQATPKPSSNS